MWLWLLSQPVKEPGDAQERGDGAGNTPTEATEGVDDVEPCRESDPAPETFSENL